MIGCEVERDCLLNMRKMWRNRRVFFERWIFDGRSRTGTIFNIELLNGFFHRLVWNKRWSTKNAVMIGTWMQTMEILDDFMVSLSTSRAANIDVW